LSQAQVDAVSPCFIIIIFYFLFAYYLLSQIPLEAIVSIDDNRAQEMMMEHVQRNGRAIKLTDEMGHTFIHTAGKDLRSTLRF
jgi:hypothetical protein